MRAALPTLLLMLSWSGPASAQEIDLSWEAPATCPDRDWVLSRVHYPEASPSRLSARAVIEKRAGGYHLELSTEQQGEEGRRSLTAPVCRELGEVTAALLSLALRSQAPPEPVAAPRVDPPPPAPPARASLWWWGEFGARAAMGGLPAASVGPVVQLSAERETLRLEVGAYGLVPVRSQEEATTRHSLLSGVLSICAAWGQVVMWGGCIGSEVGVLMANAEDITDPRSRTDLWIAPRLAVYLGFRRGPFSVQLRPGAGAPVVRPRYRIEPFGEVFQPAPLLGSLDLLVGLRL